MYTDNTTQTVIAIILLIAFFAYLRYKENR